MVDTDLLVILMRREEVHRTEDTSSLCTRVSTKDGGTGASGLHVGDPSFRVEASGCPDPGVSLIRKSGDAEKADHYPIQTGKRAFDV